MYSINIDPSCLFASNVRWQEYWKFHFTVRLSGIKLLKYHCIGILQKFKKKPACLKKQHRNLCSVLGISFNFVSNKEKVVW